MALIAFTANYTDHSNDTGFQFEFHCDKCGNGHMSTFVANKVGIAGGFLRAAASFFGGGSLAGAANAAQHVKDTLRGSAWDSAFAAAVDEGRRYFHQCTRCGKWVCPEVCWNEEKQLCEACAPDLAEEAAAAQAEAAKEQVWEKARKTDHVAKVDMAATKAAQCPHCKARVTGGKFCPSCGKPLAAKRHCSECGVEMAAGAKFCPECGTAAAAG